MVGGGSMKYKVSFVIDGDMLADNMPLDEENIKLAIERDFDISSLTYWGNRDIDTVVSELEIVEMDE